MPELPPIEDLPVLRELVGRVGRAFYDPKHIIILDALTTQALYSLPPSSSSEHLCSSE